jgi:hypothetical protein
VDQHVALADKEAAVFHDIEVEKWLSVGGV